jgi:hypothetical protein
LKNAGAKISMFFTYNNHKKFLHQMNEPWHLKKIEILGAVLELPAKQHCQSNPFTTKLDQMGLIGSAI